MPYKLEEIKILVVDDTPEMLSLAKDILETFGFKRILVCENGEEAYDQFMMQSPDIVITDWVMEPVDGLELTRRIRRDKNSPNPYVPIILMTGFRAHEQLEEARDAGITEFLSKPFKSRDLYNRITQVIEKPRQFIDTDSYFGPDRRRRKIKNYQGLKRRSTDIGPLADEIGQ